VREKEENSTNTHGFNPNLHENPRKMLISFLSLLCLVREKEENSTNTHGFNPNLHENPRKMRICFLSLLCLVREKQENSTNTHGFNPFHASKYTPSREHFDFSLRCGLSFSLAHSTCIRVRHHCLRYSPYG